MTLKIRRAGQDDVQVLCDLMTALSGHAISREEMMNRLRTLKASKVDFLFVCEDHRKIVGLLGFRLRENLEEMSRFGEISAIVVNSDSRRKGMGRFMMDYAEKIARENNCIGMWLVSGFGREEEAHKFYSKLGFQVTGYRFVKPFN